MPLQFWALNEFLAIIHLPNVEDESAQSTTRIVNDPSAFSVGEDTTFCNWYLDVSFVKQIRKNWKSI